MITFNELLERTKSNDIAIHTPTEDQAKALLNELNKKGYKWNSGDKLTTMILYGDYKEDTCYYTLEPNNRICYGSLSFYQENDYTIVEFKDIDFKEE